MQMIENVFWDSARIIRGQRRPRLRMPVFFHNHQVPAAHHPVVTLVNDFRWASDDILANPGVNVVGEKLRRQRHTGREVPQRATAQHPPHGVVDMETKIVALREEHINVLALRAVINGVLWRLRSAANIHSKGVQAMNSMVIMGALAKGRSKSRRLAPFIMKFNSLVVAASFTPLLEHCWTDLSPTDDPSCHG